MIKILQHSWCVICYIEGSKETLYYNILFLKSKIHIFPNKYGQGAMQITYFDTFNSWKPVINYWTSILNVYLNVFF